MHLDITTLLATGSFVVAVSGLLLTGAWLLIRAEPALLWWAAADFVFAIGIGFLAYGAATGVLPSQAVGGMLADAAPALVWAGTRTFVRRPVLPLPFVAGVLATFVVRAVSGADALQWSMIAGFASWIGYLLASNWELWRARAEPFKARRPLMAFFTLHMVVFFGGVHDALLQKMHDYSVPPLDSWFGLIHIETFIYVIATGACMVLLCKERSELRYIEAARIDALTGIANRGAFFAGAERLLDRCRVDGTPLSVIAFDLDRFKSVNDTHGHAVGDRVLRLFVDAARRVLRPNDLFGRHGGEEFAVVMPGATVETAYVIADRIRQAFAAACCEVDGLAIYTTVSAGVAAASLSTSFLAAMEDADRALYRAKTRGRNRVERADDSRQDKAPRIIRVA